MTLASVGYLLDYELLKDTTLYLTLKGEFWSVFCEYFGEKYHKEVQLCVECRPQLLGKPCQYSTCQLDSPWQQMIRVYAVLETQSKCCRSSWLESQIINIKLKENQQKVPSPPPKLSASDWRTCGNFQHWVYDVNISNVSLYCHMTSPYTINTVKLEMMTRLSIIV